MINLQTPIIVARLKRKGPALRMLPECRAAGPLIHNCRNVKW